MGGGSTLVAVCFPGAVPQLWWWEQNAIPKRLLKHLAASVVDRDVSATQ